MSRDRLIREMNMVRVLAEQQGDHHAVAVIFAAMQQIKKLAIIDGRPDQKGRV